MPGTAKSHYAEGLTINALLRNTPFTPPAALWLALFTVPPDDTAGSGTEVSGGAYVRQPITFSAPAPQTPTGTETHNDTLITYPTATANWGTLPAWGVFDAATAGNRVIADRFPGTPPTVVSGQTPSFPIGSIVYIED